ncbi:hypothetical protein IVB45_05780 [Bradyrhizobium sp. 4]|uniref:hypothetical protein n=1 Tax=unclassified Bradyrhizobium TaxID=2631580 RepID=UPI001FFBEDEF|nr:MULTISPECIES: hypothetical protein [unclassified Bradyrhizobium]MCK1396787.1 hypothetical protein [Bradyrhizobium sp. 39]MCK1629240.1 hypothetical protein [Bradyrhizobium sp. 162]MCK1751388.1 hypothetical protein [Bradyrhizobium sp. 135]UPJ36429.1 hypothetical protein IVB45_05780 [Bradyrhizobium sp. 4]
MIYATFIDTSTDTAAGEFRGRKIAQLREGELTAQGAQFTAPRTRQTLLLSVIGLLRYAEAEVLELKLETSAVLLGATIAELEQNLE